MFLFFMQLIGVMPSRFKNDCLINVCDRAVTCILGLHFICIYLVILLYMIDQVLMMVYFKLSTAIQSTMLTQ